MHESFVSLLSTLAPVLGLPEISVREDDPSCLLTIDDFEISLRYFPVSDLVMLSTVAAPLPAKRAEGTLRRSAGCQYLLPRHAGFHSGRAGGYRRNASGRHAAADAGRREHHRLGAEFHQYGGTLAGKMPEIRRGNRNSRTGSTAVPAGHAAGVGVRRRRFLPLFLHGQVGRKDDLQSETGEVDPVLVRRQGFHNLAPAEDPMTAESEFLRRRGRPARPQTARRKQVGKQFLPCPDAR